MPKKTQSYIYIGLTAALILSGCAPAARFTGNGAKARPVSANPAARPQTDNETSNEYLSSSNLSAEGFTEEGTASFYADKYHGRKTANGEIYNMYDLTAAHPTLPLGVKIRVTNLENGRKAILRVNDRMPKHPDRIIDLSYKAAIELDFVKQGLTKVKIETVK